MSSTTSYGTSSLTYRSVIYLQSLFPTLQYPPVKVIQEWSNTSDQRLCRPSVRPSSPRTRSSNLCTKDIWYLITLITPRYVQFPEILDLYLLSWAKLHWKLTLSIHRSQSVQSMPVNKGQTSGATWSVCGRSPHAQPKGGFPRNYSSIFENNAIPEESLVAEGGVNARGRHN